MATRQITGTIYHPGGVTPWAVVEVVFRLVYYFAVDVRTYPIETYTVLTDAAGDFTINVAVPDTGTACYECLLPDGNRFNFNIAAGAVVSLEDLIILAAGPAIAQNALQTLIDTHASMASTTAHIGHVELATNAEAIAKADTERAITPSNLAALDSSETFKGFIERATVAEEFKI